jgi:hypothetical protein
VTASPAEAKVSPAVNGRTSKWPAMDLTASASRPAQNREAAKEATTDSVSTTVDAMLITESATAAHDRSHLAVAVNRLQGRAAWKSAEEVFRTYDQYILRAG